MSELYNSPLTVPLLRRPELELDESEAWERIRDLGAKHRSVRLLGCGIVALCVHASIARFASSASTEAPPMRPKTMEFAVEMLRDTPEPEPEAAPDPTPRADQPMPARPTEPGLAKAPAEPARPEAVPSELAQAGKVLTAEPNPAQPVDLTNEFQIVSGQGNRFAGGTTSVRGTSQTAVRNAALAAGPLHAANGRETGAGTGGGPNLAQRASVNAAALRRCGFPSEADQAGINSARVTLSVVIGADGRATKAKALSNPGHGFAPFAERCVLRTAHTPAQAHDGRKVTSELTLVVRFTR